MTKLERALALLPLVDKVQKSGIKCGLDYDRSIDFWYYDESDKYRQKTVENDKAYQQCINLINSLL